MLRHPAGLFGVGKPPATHPTTLFAVDTCSVSSRHAVCGASNISNTWSAITAATPAFSENARYIRTPKTLHLRAGQRPLPTPCRTRPSLPTKPWRGWGQRRGPVVFEPLFLLVGSLYLHDSLIHCCKGQATHQKHSELMPHPQSHVARKELSCPQYSLTPHAAPSRCRILVTRLAKRHLAPQASHAPILQRVQAATAEPRAS